MSNMESLVRYLIEKSVAPAPAFFATSLYLAADEGVVSVTWNECEVLADRCRKSVRKYFSDLSTAGVLVITAENLFSITAKFTLEKTNADCGKAVGVDGEDTFIEQRKFSSATCIVKQTIEKVNNNKNTNTVTEKIFDLILPLVMKRLQYLRSKAGDHSPLDENIVRREFIARIASGALKARDIINVFLSLLEIGTIKKTALALIRHALNSVYKPRVHTAVETDIEAADSSTLRDIFASVGLFDWIGKDKVVKFVNNLFGVPIEEPAPSPATDEQVQEAHNKQGSNIFALMYDHYVTREGDRLKLLLTGPLLGFYRYNKPQAEDRLREAFGAIPELLSMTGEEAVLLV